MLLFLFNQPSQSTSGGGSGRGYNTANLDISKWRKKRPPANFDKITISLGEGKAIVWDKGRDVGQVYDLSQVIKMGEAVLSRLDEVQRLQIAEYQRQKKKRRRRIIKLLSYIE